MNKPDLRPGCGRVPVWAPTADRIDLVTPAGSVPMERGDEGWWLAPEPLPDGTRYRFAVDGSGPFPDPRAVSLPDGVHDVAETWTPPPLPSDLPNHTVLGNVLYELHVGTFTPEGTLDAAIERLPHLVELGVTTVELMPVAAFPGQRGWGYDGVALYSVHSAYGGPAAYRRFVDAAHAAGLAVCQDLVLNHLGPEGNYLAQFGPYFTSRHETPWGDGFNLDGPDCGPVRGHLIGAAYHLVRAFGIDALRLDAVHEIVDDSPYHLLAELSDRVGALEDDLGHRVTLIAESDLNDYTMVCPTSAGGKGMDGQWDDDIHHALHVAFTGETHGYYKDFAEPGALAKVYTDVFFHNGTFSTFRDCPWGKPVPADLDRSRFVGFSANHDQVGNRAIGDRPQAKLSPEHAAGEAALVLLGPFTPLIFMGDEWYPSTPFQFFTDFQDPQLASGVSEGRLHEFSGHGWSQIYSGPVTVPDPQDPDTMEHSRLNWDEAHAGDHARMEAWYRTLIRLRGTLEGTPAALEQTPDLITLRRGDVTCLVSMTEDSRSLPQDLVDGRVLASFGADPAQPTCLPGYATLVIACSA